MLADLREGFDRFRLNPVGEALLALLFLLAALSGIFLGPAAVLYLWHLNPQAPEGPLRALMITQRLQGSRRIGTTFWLGLGIWVMAVLPSLRYPFLGLPVWWLLMQPLWLAILLADRFDLRLAVACRATLRFIIDAPGKAFICILLGFLAFSGTLLFGIGMLITLPIALRATLRFLDTCAPELSVAVQKAY